MHKEGLPQKNKILNSFTLESCFKGLKISLIQLFLPPKKKEKNPEKPEHLMLFTIFDMPCQILLFIIILCSETCIQKAGAK